MPGVVDTVAVLETSVADCCTDSAAVRLNAVVQSIGHSGIPIPPVAIRSWLPSRGPIPNRA